MAKECRMGGNMRPKCNHCKCPADVVERDTFYSCAKCWLRKHKEKRYAKSIHTNK